MADEKPTKKTRVIPQTAATMKRKKVVIEERQHKALAMWIIDKKTYREIAKELGVGHSQINNDINAAIEKLSERREIELAINVRREFGEQLRFAKKLRKAAEEYLNDPDDPLKLVISPRADEIDVIYYDNADKNERGKPTKKTETLAALLDMLNADPDIKTDRVVIKHMDMRKFALDAVGVTDVCIDKFAKLDGAYMKEKANPADNLAIAKKVVEDLIAQGKDKVTAVEYAVGRYGVLEAELLNV